MTNVTRKTHLTDAKIRELRHLHADIRRESLEDPTSYETPTATDKYVADMYGITVAAVARIVMGMNRPDAGGPVDALRAAEWRQFREDANTTTEAVARRRRAWRKDSHNRPLAPLTVTVTSPSGEVQTIQTPAGSTVSVTSASTVSLETAEDSDDRTEAQA